MLAPESKSLVAALACRDFELTDGSTPLSFEQLEEALANHFALLLDTRLEYLLSQLYLMDVDERLVHHALSPACAEPANVALARIVIERLIRKAQTRAAYRTQENRDAGIKDEELA